MISLLMIQKSAPDITNVLLLLIGILAFILILSSLYDWLKSKPWRKSGSIELTSATDIPQQHVSNASQEVKNKQSPSSDLFSEQTLHAPAGG
jgi:hypothetical protein